MGYLKIISEEEYLMSDFEWPTVCWVGDENQGLVRYSPNNGYSVYNAKNSILELKDGGFYVKE